MLASDCTDSPVRLLSCLGVVMSCVAKILPGSRVEGTAPETSLRLRPKNLKCCRDETYSSAPL